MTATLTTHEGSFSGRTLVLSPDGNSYSLTDLALDWSRGKEHWGYAMNESGEEVPAKLEHPRITSIAHELLDVTLDNGCVVRCTPAHEFRLRDASYRSANELLPTDELMTHHAGENGYRTAVSLVEVSATEDVYGVTVEIYHNFALTAGIFAHNHPER
jgi:hypothetical protein